MGLTKTEAGVRERSSFKLTSFPLTLGVNTPHQLPEPAVIAPKTAAANEPRFNRLEVILITLPHPGSTGS